MTPQGFHTQPLPQGLLGKHAQQLPLGRWQALVTPHAAADVFRQKHSHDRALSDSKDLNQALSWTDRKTQPKADSLSKGDIQTESGDAVVDSPEPRTVQGSNDGTVGHYSS